MASLKTFLEKEIHIPFISLLIAIFFGTLYSLHLLGVVSDYGTLLEGDRVLSSHISLMLYGFFPLILSLLPFALIDKDNLLTPKILNLLSKYFLIWNIFLLFIIISFMFGNNRGLPFYDFLYGYNFLLVLSGVFYILALIEALKQYKINKMTLPLWIKISLGVVITAPFLLIFLMNPDYGQVEHSLIGPHGDNTLGMSFALIPLYYLLIKLNSQNQNFKPRFAILWLIPFIGYMLSLIIRNFIAPLSYNQEWFFQYLTLLYIPLLIVWLKDAKITINSNPFLWLSIFSFLFIDIEGNILFIPQLREIFHRNNLVIGHAHIAMGVSVAFMSFSILNYYFKKIFSKTCALVWTVLIFIMAFALSIVGFNEAQLIDTSIEFWWWIRTIVGIILLGMLIYIYLKTILKSILNRLKTTLSWYHFVGFNSDFFGGIILLIAAVPLYKYLGFSMDESYGYIVFSFMLGTGVIHLFGLIYNQQEKLFAKLSSYVRIFVSATFLALYGADMLEQIALFIGLYDLIFALIYLLLINST